GRLRGVDVRTRALALLGIVAGVCLLLLTLQMRGRSVGASDALALVTTPIQTVLARVNRATLGVWGTYRDWKNVRVENRRLRDETQRLRVEALRVTETDAENQRLRRLLTLKESLPLETMAGEIIARRGSALFSYAQVTPAVDFARIDEVLLLTGGAARDVAASFRSDG